MIDGIPRPGETLAATTSGIQDPDGVSQAVFAYQWIRQNPRSTTNTEIDGATGPTYTVTTDDSGNALKVRVTFTDDGDNEESVTSEATAAVRKLLTATIVNAPDSHNGRSSFTFELHLSEENETSHRTLQDNVFTVTNGEIISANRLNRKISRKWEMTVQPDGDQAVTIALPATTDCTAAGAICSRDGNKLSSTVRVTVPGPAGPNSPATGTPTISGTAQVGETLTADTSGIADANGLTGATFSYQWNRQSLSTAVAEDIPGATASTHTAAAEDEGHALRVTVKFTDDAGYEESLTSREVEVAQAQQADPKGPGGENTEQQKSNDPATGAPTISGTAQVGQTLTAGASAIADADGLENASFSYQWIADDVEIASAAGSSHTLTSGEQGKTIRVRVNFTDDAGNSESLTSAATAAVRQPVTASTSNAPGSHDGQSAFTFDLRFSEEFGIGYRTLRDHAFTVTGGDVVKASRLNPPSSMGWEITVEPDGNAEVSVSLPATTDCAGEGAICTEDGRMLSRDVELTVPRQGTQQQSNTPATGAPTITGAAQVGETLTASTSGISDSDGLTNATFSYTWLADGAEINGAESSAHTLVAGDEGKAIRVKVSFTDDGGFPESVTSAATAAVAPRPNTPATGLPAISGTVQVGETLTVSTSAIADEDGLSDVSYAYQWTSGESDISGATASSHTLTSIEQGQTIGVRVTFDDDAGNRETLTGAQTAAVAAAPNAPATGASAISGTAQVGQTLTAGTPGIADEDGLTDAVFAYQWLADDVEIASATSSAYTLAAADEGRAIRVTVSFTDDAGNSEELTSAATDPVAAAPTPNSPATGAPTISGTAQVGQILTADTSGIADEDGLTKATFAHQWMAGTTDIAEATGSGHTLTSSQQGQSIRVKVTFTDDGGNSEELTSAATFAVAPPPLTATLESGPDSHDGSASFTFELHFSEEFYVSFRTLRNHAFTVTGGQVTGVQRLEQGKNAGWEITVQPGGDDTVTIALPVTTDCASDGAICTSDRRMLSNSSTVTVPGPATQGQQAENSPATGLPTITGAATVGETLSVNLSAVSDENGMTNASHSHQWMADDVNLQGATGAAYTLADGDEGKAIRVKVSFTDDDGFLESVTSAATAAVAAAPNTPATGLPAITGTAQVGETLTVSTSAIADTDGLTNATFVYQWIAGGTDIEDATASTYTVLSGDEGKAIKVTVSFTDDAGNSESLTSAATESVAARPSPLTASISGDPGSHDGSASFTFDLRFSEEFGVSYKTMRDHVFTVTGGEVIKARRLNPPSNTGWEIHVTPDGDGDVTIVLPVTTDCTATGAVCTGDGRPLSNRLELSVSGPSG